ncbi:MAG TPA: prepilin-type N-terminal cleavage/methylation domain-containing protein [Candidatus Colwellbacteria bacterium]|nr:prepilin-type N-terminal cleavage/methylation domain-containing protein [Candidatus Colwellbacteria bacterium]
MPFSQPPGRKAFTLIELLVVIGILAVLSAVTVVVLNPAELLAESRDSVRLSDLKSINDILFVYTTQKGEPGGNPNYVYLSLPDNNSSCSSHSLPALPAPYQYSCVREADLRKVDSTGWIPVNLASIPGGSPIPVLPVDPENSASYYYTYMAGGSYEITALLESERYLKSSALKDKGIDPARMEMGTNLSLWNLPSGLVAYWPFDGSGSIANGQALGLEDQSPFHNNGTASNANGSGMAFVEGKVGNALYVDGVDDWVNAGNNASLNISGPITLAAWFNTSAPGGASRIVSKQYSDTSETTATSCYQLGYYQSTYRFSLYTNTGGSLDRQVGAPGANVWNHLIGTWNGSTYQIYANGNLIYSNNFAGVLKTNPVTPLSIGASYADEAMYFAKGNLDEVRIYNRALSAEEARAIYKAEK